MKKTTISLLLNIALALEIIAGLEAFLFQFDAYKKYHLHQDDWMVYLAYCFLSLIGLLLIHSVKKFLKKYFQPITQTENDRTNEPD